MKRFVMIHFVENDTSFIVLLANLTLYIAFYVILNMYFDGGCQPYWIWPSRRPHTKTKIILFVCYVIISMEKDNSLYFWFIRYIAFNEFPD